MNIEEYRLLVIDKISRDKYIYLVKHTGELLIRGNNLSFKDKDVAGRVFDISVDLKTDKPVKVRFEESTDNYWIFIDDKQFLVVGNRDEAVEKFKRIKRYFSEVNSEIYSNMRNSIKLKRKEKHQRAQNESIKEEKKSEIERKKQLRQLEKDMLDSENKLYKSRREEIEKRELDKVENVFELEAFKIENVKIEEVNSEQSWNSNIYFINNEVLTFTYMGNQLISKNNYNFPNFIFKTVPIANGKSMVIISDRIRLKLFNENLSIVDELKSYLSNIKKIINEKTTLIKKNAEELTRRDASKYKHVFMNFISNSDFDNYLNPDYLIAFEMYIRKKYKNIKLDLYSSENMKSEDPYYIANDFAQNYVEENLQKLINIVDRKIDGSSKLVTLLFVLKMIKIASVEYYSDKFIKRFGDLAEESIDLEYILTVYYDNTRGEFELSDNFGLLVFYLISRKLVSENYLSSYGEMSERLTVVKDTFDEKQLEVELFKHRNYEDEHLTIDDVDLMDGHEFEHFVADLFSKMGYLASVTKGSGDQGVDVIASKKSNKIGIQAKNYSSNVTNTAIQEIVAGINHYKLSKGMVITNSYFTSSARELARTNNIILWDRVILKEKLTEYM